MKTKSLLNRRVQLALGAAILASLVVGAISYRSMVAEGPITLLVTEVGSQTGWLSEDVRAQQSQGVRDVLQGCEHSDLDITLAQDGLAGATELFSILAITDEIGREAIAKRVQQRLIDYEHIQKADYVSNVPPVG
jgi:hypothetical protein